MKISRINTICKYNTPNFNANKRTEEQNQKENERRTKKFEKIGVHAPFSSILADLETNRYKKALSLARQGVSSSCIEEVSELNGRNYLQALILITEGINDGFLYQIANLDKETYKKAIKYMKKGFDDDCLKLFAELTKDEEKEALKLLKEGFSPIVAGNLSKLTLEQQQIAIKLVSERTEIREASKIVQLEEKQRNKAINYIKNGVMPEFAAEIASLNKEEEKRLPEIFSLKIGDVNVTDFAKLNDEDYQRALELINQNVNPDYIIDILEIENNKTENTDYEEYRARGYGYTSSFALSLLEEKEIEALEELREMHPEIRTLLNDEYDITILQLQNNKEKDAIFTKTMRTDTGTKIKIVKTFDGYNESTTSRLEEYENGETSSIMSQKSNVFKLKYDKFGEISEIIEIIQDGDTREVTGVIKSTASKILKGAFESVYYSINDFKESSSGTTELIEIPIEQAVKNSGETFSTVKQLQDGTIIFEEDFQLNDLNTKRNYSEKRDNNNKIINSSYNYKIINDVTKETLMDISRSFTKTSSNSAINTINGITYQLSYDDKEKTINVSDGRKEKKLNFAKILPEYSEEIIWEQIKELQVDSILTIYKNIKKWHYCQDEDSAISAARKVLSSGKNINIIEHETGHIKSDEDCSIFDNDELCQIYGTEMDTFQKNVPYNEQEFVQYFSPRADIMDADGISEMIAETNILLSSYGTRSDKTRTRTYLVAKYFPQTIAKIAELTGKTSTKSLL